MDTELYYHIADGVYFQPNGQHMTDALKQTVHTYAEQQKSRIDRTSTYRHIMIGIIAFLICVTLSAVIVNLIFIEVEAGAEYINMLNCIIGCYCMIIGTLAYNVYRTSTFRNNAKFIVSFGMIDNVIVTVVRLRILNRIKKI